MTGPGRRFDIAIIGAGPNGLTAAAYLSTAGAEVAVLERRFERGGTMTSDDYSTPFTYNIAQASLPLGAELPAVADLGLAGHGVAFVEPGASVEVITRADRRMIGRGGAGLSSEIEAMFASIGRACPPALYQPPVPEAKLLDRWRADGETAAADLADATPGSLAALAATEPLALAVRYACAEAGFADPGQRLGPVGGFAVARFFSPVLVAGGSKSLPNALFRVAASRGADCRVTAAVTRVSGSAGAFRLACADGSVLTARAVISTLDPAATFAGLLDPGLVPAALAGIAGTWRHDDYAPFTAHFGIRGEPPGGGREPQPFVRLIGFETAADLDAHLRAARRGELPDRPAGALSVTTAHDPLQASPGPFGPLHTLRFDTFGPLRHPAGEWDRHRRGYRERCWDYLRDQVPELDRVTLIARFADAPGDLTRRFGTTTGGTTRQGALIPEQTLTGRPHPDCAATRTPVDGFYIGGGSVHPGVPGLLAGGMLAARAVAADLGRDGRG